MSDRNAGLSEVTYFLLILCSRMEPKIKKGIMQRFIYGIVIIFNESAFCTTVNC